MKTLTGTLRILLVEDNPFDAELIQKQLDGLNRTLEIERVDTRAGFVDAVDRRPDIVLIDYNLPAFDMFSAMEIVRDLGLDIPFIVVTGHVGDELAAECIKRGASDYVLKDRLGRLDQAVRTALEQVELKQRATEMQLQLQESESRFRALIEGSRDVVAVVGPDATLKFVTPGITDLTGFTAEELLGQDMMAYVHPRDLELAATGLQEILQEPNKRKNVEARAQKKGGGWIWVEITAANRLDDPAIEGIVVNYHDITERKAAADRLASSERILATAQAISHVGSFEWDFLEGSFIWSAEMFRILGYEPDEVEPDFRLFLSHVVEEDQQRVHDSYMRCMAESEHICDEEFRIKRRDGSLRWIHGVGHVTIEEGRPQLMAGSHQDITERKEMERELLASEELFRNAFNFGTSGMALIAPDDRYLSVNDSLCKMVGYSREELLTMNWRMLTHPDDLEVNVRQLRELIEGNSEPYILTKRYIHKDGSAIWVEMCDAVVKDPEGNALYVVTQIQDVTDRKKALEALQESQELLRGVIDNSPAVIYIKKTDGSYALASRSWLEMFAKRPEEVLGRTDLDVFPEPTARAFMEVDARVFGSGTAVECEEVATTSDGSTHRYRSLKFPLFDRTGACYALCGISEDITEKAQAEREREDLHAQLRQAQKMEAVGQLAGGIAHDFNNILAVILNYAEFLIEDLDPDDPRLGDAREIVKAGDRAAQLVHQLLAFSRKEVVEPKVLALDEVINGLHELLRRTIGEDIRLEIEVAGELPRVLADLGQLEQVVLNLVVNARDAMPNGGTLSISIESEDLSEGDRPGLPGGHYACLTVSDTGEGMDQATIERVFEPFFTTKERGAGTGLGLATVYGIVKQAGGGVYVRSEIGRGSRFEVYLPSTTFDLDECPADMPSPELHGSGRIMVVEDEEAVRELVSRILLKNGYEVVTFASGREALEHCEEGRCEVDLLLTDVVMPEMSGKDLADRIASQRPDIKTMFMSGYTDEIVAQRGVLDGGEHLIKKPFKAEDLLDKIRTVIGVSDA